MGNWSMLPTDIILEIFIRIPAESILDCKGVCKPWRNLISHPSFAEMHINRLNDTNSGKLSFIFCNREPDDVLKVFYYMKYDENANSEIQIARINLNSPLSDNSTRIMGSCNGLICLSEYLHHESLDREPIYICNPITRECVWLPKLKIQRRLVDVYLLTGFGYVSSTNEYKVVRMYNKLSLSVVVQIEVYTLGSGKGWRHIGNHGNSLKPFYFEEGYFANGYLYWMLKTRKIAAFNLADEILVELRTPSLLGMPRNSEFGLLGDHLFVTDRTNNGTLSVWLWKKKEDGTWSWSEEFSLTDGDEYSTPVALISRGELLCFFDTKVMCHDQKSSSSKRMLVDFGKFIYQAIPHVNTLVSLKSLGEENVEAMA